MSALTTGGFCSSFGGGRPGDPDLDRLRALAQAPAQPQACLGSRVHAGGATGTAELREGSGCWAAVPGRTPVRPRLTGCYTPVPGGGPGE